MKKSDRKTLLCSFVLSILILSTAHASAYTDPSVSTYTIQAIVGVAVALSAVVAIWWRKAKHKVTKTLGIDENKNKVVEDEIQEINNEDEN